MDGATLQIENSAIAGFASDPLLFQPSGASQLFMNNTTIRNNQGSIWVAPTGTGTATASFNNVRLENNQRGIRVDDGTTAVIRNSIATGNLVGNGFGVFSVAAAPRPAVLTIENSTSSRNGGNGLVSNGTMATLRLSNVTATDNGHSSGTGVGLFVTAGGSVYSFGGNRFAGNAGGDVSGAAFPLPQIAQQ